MGEIFRYLMRNATVENKIAELREEMGLSQEELAKILGYSVGCMAAIERGAALPTIRSAYVMSKFFDKSIEEIFIFKENKLEELDKKISYIAKRCRYKEEENGNDNI